MKDIPEVKILKTEYERLKRDQMTLDRIKAVIDQAYDTDENGELLDDNKDLGWIGEKVAAIMGAL